MSTLRVLLIEGEPGGSEHISSALSEADHAVLPAAGLEEASEALLIQKFDAVLLSFSAPADGIANFAAKLRDLEKRQSTAIRVPLLSCSPGVYENDGARNAIDGYLPSRFDEHAFLEAVTRLSSRVPETPEGPIPTRAGEPIFEPDKFQEQVAFDTELLIEIVDLFLLERLAQMDEMRRAFAESDLEQLGRVAHTIKGSLSSLHAPRARARAQDLELAAKESCVETCRHLLAQLEHDLTLLEPELVALRNAFAK